MFVTLTDELPPLDPVGSLLQSYPNYVQLRMENSRTMGEASETIAENIEDKNPLEHFVDFFFSQNNGQMPTANQMEMMRRIVKGRLTPLLIMFLCLVVPQLFVQSMLGNYALVVVYLFILALYIAIFAFFGSRYIQYQKKLK